MTRRTEDLLGKLIDRDLKRGSKVSKLYKTGLIDPPWQTLTYSGTSLPQRAKKQHYDQMSLDDLMDLPIFDLFERDAYLFMWIIGTHVDQGIRLAEHWGFRYTTDAFWWRKIKKGLIADIAKGKLPPECIGADDAKKMGMGKIVRKNGEMLYLFSKGKPSPIHGGMTGEQQEINAPIREHSRKPDETYARIEAVAPGPFVELFSRTTAPGWAVWGNETGKFDPKPARKGPRSANDLLG